MKKWWLEHPWRLVQTNLRETDFLGMEAERFADDVIKLGATVVMISTSGIVANYPTKLSYQYRNPYASDTVLGEVVDACHAKGIRVIGRMDFSKVREPMSSQHPEWAFVGEGGQRVCYNGDTHVCCNSDYQRRLSLNILRETLEMLPIDGVFFNFGGYTSGYDYSGNLYGDCVCENCKRRFYQMFGEELPAHPSKSPQYEEFKRRTLQQTHQEVRDVVNSVRPGLCIFNDYFSEEGVYRAEAGSSLYGGDWHYSAADLANRARTGYPNMRASITTVDFADIAYRYASPNKERQEHRLAESLAYGGVPDLYIMGRLDNRENQSGIQAASNIFHWHATHEQEMNLQVPQGEILLVRPETHWLANGIAIQEYQGWFEILSQRHYLFRAIDEKRLPTIDLSAYRTVILPAVQVMGEIERVLHKFVQQGGNILITSCGSTIPDWIGVSQMYEWTADTRGGYVFCSPEQRGLHMNLEKSTVLPIVGGYAHCDYKADVLLKQAVIQPHNYGPPERCYYTSISEEPAYTIRKEEEGYALWIPWLPGYSFKKSKLVTISNWITDLLTEEVKCKPLETDAPICVEIAITKNCMDEYLLSFVNGSGDMGGDWTRPLPVGPIEITIPAFQDCIPEGLDGECFFWKREENALSLSISLNKVLTVLRLRSIGRANA